MRRQAEWGRGARESTLTAATTDATSGCWSARGKKNDVTPLVVDDCAAAIVKMPLAKVNTVNRGMFPVVSVL